MKCLQIMEIFVRFYIYYIRDKKFTNVSEALKNTWVALVDKLEFYTLKMPLQA